MFTFLRKVRKSLIETGSARKYLLYATGEIALVVIGILIALQINNWNEWRKERELEIKILAEISENIQVDYSDHNQNIMFMENTIYSSGIILNHLNNNLAYHDSLSSHFVWLSIIPDFYSVNTGYKLLSSKGVNLITNDSLRKDISYLYDNTQLWVKEFFAFLKSNSFRLLLEDMVPKFKNYQSIQSYEPMNYEVLQQDSHFKSYVQFNMEYIRSFNDMYKKRIEIEKDLVRRIEKEIELLRE